MPVLKTWIALQARPGTGRGATLDVYTDCSRLFSQLLRALLLAAPPKRPASVLVFNLLPLTKKPE